MPPKKFPAQDQNGQEIFVGALALRLLIFACRERGSLPATVYSKLFMERPFYKQEITLEWTLYCCIIAPLGEEQYAAEMSVHSIGGLLHRYV